MEYFGGLRPVEIDEDQLELAEQLIKRKTGKFNPDKYQDGYEVALKELVDAKVNHQPIPQEEPAPRRAKVVNLMDALRDSLRNGVGASTNDEETTPKKAPRSEKKADAAKESSKVLKMPAKKAAPKPAARSGRSHAKSA